MKQNKTTTKPEFKEFKFSGNNNLFDGRMYETVEKDGVKKTSLSLTINGLAIHGCKLIEKGDKCFIALPQYKSGDEWKPIIHFVTAEDAKDLSELAEYIKTL